MKFLFVFALALSLGTQARAQTMQAAMSALNATPFNCEAFRQTVTGAQGYQLLANEYTGDIIVERLLAVSDAQCHRDFMHYYAWDIVNYGDPATPPQISTERLPRQLPCMPAWMRGNRPCPPSPQAVREQQLAEATTLHTRRREQTLRNLRRLTAARHGNATIMASGQNLMCLPQDEAFDFLITAARESREALSCLRPAVGETKIVNHLDEVSPTGTGMNYAIVNKGNNSHDILVPMQFTVRDDSSMDADTMMARVQSCLRDVSPFMRGPRGERLNVVILDDQDLAERPIHQRPNPNLVNIWAPGRRIDRDNYTTDIDCATITHEVLHILGLCDEYRETNPAYPGSCRSLHGGHSIMADHTESLHMATGATFECECSGYCQSIQAGSDQKRRDFFVTPRMRDIMAPRTLGTYCRQPYDIDPTYIDVTPELRFPAAVEVAETGPDGVMRIIERTDLNELIQERTYVCGCVEAEDQQECQTEMTRIRTAIQNPQGAMLRNCPNNNTPIRTRVGASENAVAFDPNRQLISVSIEPTLPSLLYPSHYNRIVGGYCPSVTPQYNECARWAYTDLKDANGQLTNSCPGRPAQCSDPAYFLGAP